MNSKQRARIIVIAAMGAAVILAWVVARATNRAFEDVLMIEGLFIVVVGLVLALVGVLLHRRNERTHKV